MELVTRAFHAIMVPQIVLSKEKKGDVKKIEKCIHPKRMFVLHSRKFKEFRV